jgi:hypothetical protein
LGFRKAGIRWKKKGLAREGVSWRLPFIVVWMHGGQKHLWKGCGLAGLDDLGLPIPFDIYFFWILLVGIVFIAPLLTMHLYAKVYVESTIERPDDCKDPNSRPGSRADGVRHGEAWLHLSRRTPGVVNAWSADSWMLLSTMTPMIAIMTAATQANKNALMMMASFQQSHPPFTRFLTG